MAGLPIQAGTEGTTTGKAERSGNPRTRARSGGREDSVAQLMADPATARLLATFDELASGTSTGEPNKKLVEACRGTLMDNDGARRSRNFALLLELARAEDAPAIHSMFAELHREGRAFDEYKTFAMRWGMVDPIGAMKFLGTQHKDGIIPRGDLRALAFGWGRVAPDAALKWMDENSQEAESPAGGPRSWTGG